LKFFTNAVNTVTEGSRYLEVNYYTSAIGKGRLGVIAAFNYNETKIDNIAVPSILAKNGYSENFFDRKEQSRIGLCKTKTKKHS
jgi:iron complex outermembrane receptor protein